jgi:hypothetical protein
MLREVERTSDDIAEFQCNLATSQYPISIESQITMRVGSYLILRGSDTWCRGVICSAMKAGKAGRGQAMPQIWGLGLGGRDRLFLVLIDRMSSAVQTSRREAEFRNPWQLALMRDAIGRGSHGSNIASVAVYFLRTCGSLPRNHSGVTIVAALFGQLPARPQRHSGLMPVSPLQ